MTRSAPAGSSTNPARGKRAAWSLALLAGAASAIAIANWETIAIGYHLIRLRDEQAFDAVLTGPRDRLEEEAFHKYLRTTRGGIRLSEKFLESFFEQLEAQEPEFLPGALCPGQIVGFALCYLGREPSTNPWFLVDGPRTLTKRASGDALAVRLIPLFRFVDHREFALAGHPGVRITIWAYEDDLNANEVIVEGRMVRERGAPSGPVAGNESDRCAVLPSSLEH